MNLAIDIGNTHTKIGLFVANEAVEVFMGEEALADALQRYNVGRAIVSKTGKNDTVEKLLKENKVETLALSPTVKLPIQMLYKTPETLGADRVAGSVAANFLYPGKNILKIDFGTCITYDFVSAAAEYQGGAISPGMMMRFKALHNYTAKLPLVDPMQFTAFELTGTDTTTSILSGVVNGIKEEVNGIIKEYDARFGNLQVVATGGDSLLFVTLLKCEIFARPYLVLEGLNRILNYNL
ncbi:MAG TPA: type III pantothenate kinase [Chitinophagales bacterium]|nr:type III pantothenate kinase [Chitinophagales bacterium]